MNLFSPVCRPRYIVDARQRTKPSKQRRSTTSPRAFPRALPIPFQGPQHGTQPRRSVRLTHFHRHISQCSTVKVNLSLCFSSVHYSILYDSRSSRPRIPACAPGDSVSSSACHRSNDSLPLCSAWFRDVLVDRIACLTPGRNYAALQPPRHLPAVKFSHRLCGKAHCVCDPSGYSTWS